MTTSMAAQPTNPPVERAARASKPVCPEWCLPQWCDVRPVINPTDRLVSHWAGWHIGDVHVVNIVYGLVAEIAPCASFDEPDYLGVYLRIATREDGDAEMIAILTEDEAMALRRGLVSAVEDVAFYRTHPGEAVR